MTVAEIRSNITYNENLIDQYTSQKRELERQIGELDLLASKFAGLQSRFGDRQSQRQSKLSLFLSSGLQNKILSRYYNGMSGLLGGADFNNAYNGLSDAKSKIHRKITELDQRIDECNNQISYRRGRREYWLSQLAAATAEGAE